MIKPYILSRHDTCSICKGQRSIELYDKYDNPLHYQQCIDTKSENKLFYKNARYFKCKKCQTRFNIKWNGEVPIPAIDIDFLMFAQLYKKDSESL